MSQHLGPTPSTSSPSASTASAGNANASTPSGQPQQPVLSFGSLDTAAQQAFLQQLAARGPNNPAAAALFASLTNNIQQQQQRKLSGPGLGGPGAQNGSALTTGGFGVPPQFAAAAAVAAGAGANPPSPSQPTDVAGLQAQLTARLMQQAAALRQAQTAAGMAGQQPAPPGAPANLPDWASAAAASGMLTNMGTDREAIMKQLAALHQSQQNRAKHAASIGAVGSPVNPTAPSPSAMAAPSPAAITAPSPAATAPSPAPSASAHTPIATTFDAPSPSVAALAAAARPPGTPTATGLPAPPGAALGGHPVRSGMPPHPQALQKPALLGALANFYKTTNQSLPAEVFNGENDGSFKLGDVWIDVAELFVAVFRLGGLIKVTQSGKPTENPVWQQILASKGVPTTLATPVALPRQPGTDPNAPPQMTTSSVQYLASAYRAWIFGFEQAMARSKMAAFQKQQQMAAAATSAGAARPAGPARPAAVPTPSAPIPTAAALTPSPAIAHSPATATLPGPILAPTHPVSAPTPVPPAPLIVTAHVPPTPTAPSPAIHSPAKPVEAPYPVPHSQVATPVAVNGTPPADPKGKRKREARTADKRSATPTTAPVAPEPPAPKRVRHRVEYRPLHFPHPMMGGWDERTIARSFPKHQMGRPTRPVQMLQVDIEAILMGLRSRLPTEVGYGLTALSMMSMPVHDGKAQGLSLPIEPLTEVYLEVIDLIAESALGDEEGVAKWVEQQQAAHDLSASHSSVSREQVERMTYSELEQLGSDLDYVVEDEENVSRDHTSGKTDIIFTGLNIIKNFSMLPDNHSHMARPELFNLLAAITDSSLMRLPGDSQSTHPYSVLEYARVCRDAVAIIGNLGLFDLRVIPKVSVLAIIRLLSSFLVCAWQILQKREPSFGPSVSIHEVPPATVFSIDRALEAFCRLTLPDHNREVIATVVPSDELVELFAGLVKLFPLSAREIEALRTVEMYLARIELVAQNVYSLAFLAPQHARTGMRTAPGTTHVMTRLVYGLAPFAAAPTRPASTQGQTAAQAQAQAQAAAAASQFTNLVRRITETLGVLNGTVTPGGNADRMCFSAGGIDGKGWRFASDAVEPGWLAHDTDRVLEAMGWGRGDGRGWRVDGPTFAELDGLWST